VSELGLTESLRDQAGNLACNIFGVADPFAQGIQRAPEGHRPQDYLQGVKSVVALGVRVLNPILQTAPSGIYSKHYDTLNEMLNTGAYRLSRWLEDEGFKSMYFPETDSYEILWDQYNAGYERFVPCFNHMAAAEAAGLGKMGVCGVLLTPQHGPRQRWISVLTEAPLDPGNPLEEEVCLEKLKPGSCGKCAEACPIQAISLEGGTDVRRCWIQWTDQRKKGMACGMCIKACPIGDIV